LLDSLSMLYDKLLHVDSYRFLFIQIIYKLWIVLFIYLFFLHYAFIIMIMIIIIINN
jgi:hypothetical protein